MSKAEEIFWSAVIGSVLSILILAVLKLLSALV